MGADFQSGFCRTSPSFPYQCRLWDDTWALCHSCVFTGFPALPYQVFSSSFHYPVTAEPFCR